MIFSGLELIFGFFVVYCVYVYRTHEVNMSYDWSNQEGVGYSDAEKRFGFYEGMWMNQNE